MTVPGKGAGMQTSIGSPPYQRGDETYQRRQDVASRSVRMRSAAPAEACGGCGGKLFVFPVPGGSSRFSPGFRGASQSSLCPRGKEAAAARLPGFPLSFQGQVKTRKAPSRVARGGGAFRLNLLSPG